jgi:TetR/AcrR family fatty acid metabolism transcriptional regulator
MQKSKILSAAEKIMSEKGVAATSIASIAREANVTDSLIYTYYKSKEDLIFSIPGRRMEEVLNNLSEQLEGIVDPVSRLSKMIWFHLHFNDTYREYARLLLFECRSNPSFYKHEAYSLIRKYAGIMIGILLDGVKRGAFRPNLNMRLVRDMIFGLLDWESLNVLASYEIKESVADFEDILSLLLPMIGPRSGAADQKASKRNLILTAAENVFAEKGYVRATVSEIAKLAHVSEGTIYEYFKNKEDLLLSIPEERFKEHMASLEEIFEIKTPLRKLRRLVRNHFLIYMTERNFLKVFLLHIQLNQNFYQSSGYKTFQTYTKLITDILEEAKEAGTIRENVNPRVFRNLFLGAFSHMALRWLILGKELEIDKMQEIDEVVQLLCDSITSGRQSE